MQGRTSYWWKGLLTGVGVLLMVAGIAPVAWAQEKGTEDIETRRQERFEKRMDTAIANIWWNQDEVAAKLGLTKAQRRAMDEAFLTQWQHSRDATLLRRQVRQDYKVALDAEQWKQVTDLARQAGEFSARIETARLLEKTSVLELLSHKQLEALRLEYPHLLTQRWIRNLRQRRPHKKRGGSRVDSTQPTAPANQ